MKCIKKLENAVIDKIAAGEVLVRPFHAVKEMIENSHDAGAKRIVVTVAGGGLSKLVVTDDGSGIAHADLPLVCMRHATSKLAHFDDLKSIATFGFRGEALASISNVARVTLTTRQANEDVAWRAFFIDGVLAPFPGSSSAAPLKCAGTCGTTIEVEDLFYTNAPRRKSFNPDDEYRKILEVCERYALLWNDVHFVCQKADAKAPDLNVRPSDAMARIKAVYGGAWGSNFSVEKVLFELRLQEARCHFSLEGFASVGKISALKKPHLVLFVNGRLVESAALKKAICSIYDVYALAKACGHPFVLVALTVPPANVDVNVHPTKNEVFLLNGDEIVARIVSYLQESLQQRSAAVEVTFEAPFRPVAFRSPPVASSALSAGNSSKGVFSAPSTPKRDAPSKTVRTDDCERTLDNFWSSPLSPSYASPGLSDAGAENSSSESSLVIASRQKQSSSTSSEDLRSIFELREEFRKRHFLPLNAAEGSFFKSYVHVGIVDDRLSLCQMQTGLFMFNYRQLIFSLVYWELLEKFRAYDLFIEIPNQQIAKNVAFAGILAENGAMLADYFGIEYETATQNLLLPAPLPAAHFTDGESFVGQIATLAAHFSASINWKQEKECLEGVLCVIANFYTALFAAEHVEHWVTAQKENFKRISFGLQAICSAPTQLPFGYMHFYGAWGDNRSTPHKCPAFSQSIAKVVDVHDLYKVFERC